MAKAAKRQEDVAAAIMDRIMASPVPDKGRLSNPFQKAEKPQAAGRQVTLEDFTGRPDAGLPREVEQWSTRDLLTYFARRFQKHTGGNYLKAFGSDSQTFQKARNFLKSNGLAPGEWTKRWIDWGFDHYEDIVRKDGFFTPQSLARHLNRFYQMEVMPLVEEEKIERTEADMSLMQQIQEADAQGKLAGIFATFGIPVSVTYLVKTRGLSEGDVVAALEKRFGILSAGGPKEQQQLSDIFQMSIIKSPYPEGFLLREWRTLFADFTAPYRGEGWWRDQDYRGKPLPEYQPFLSE